MLEKLRNMISERTGDERGFTLVELMMVMVIIGVLAGLGFTGFNALQRRADQAQADVYWRDLNSAVQMYRVANGTYPEHLADLTHETEGFLDDDVKPWDGTVSGFQYALPDEKGEGPVCVKVGEQVAGPSGCNSENNDVNWNSLGTGGSETGSG